MAHKKPSVLRTHGKQNRPNPNRDFDRFDHQSLTLTAPKHLLKIAENVNPMGYKKHLKLNPLCVIGNEMRHLCIKYRIVHFQSCPKLLYTSLRMYIHAPAHTHAP